jgi:hypothetical protein
MSSKHAAKSLLLLLPILGVANIACADDLLYSNGPIITNPTGGTGSIAGLPLSNADGFTVPGSTFLFSTTGVNGAANINTALADDFTVPAGGWQLSSLTVFAFQTSQTTATVTNIRVNLWRDTPFSANSPAPVPDPLPEPMLASPLVLAAGRGTFVCHRESPSSTSTVRPVFSYTVPLTGLPNGGLLEAGTYWIQWSYDGASSPSANVFTPLVSPRSSVTGHNARLFNSVDGQSSTPRSWFEGREGYVAGQADGRAYALPFILRGTIPAPTCPADINQDGGIDGSDIEAFFSFWEAGDTRGDFNHDGGIDGSDVESVFAAWEGGC